MYELIPLFAHLIAMSCYTYSSVSKARRGCIGDMSRDLLVGLSYGMLCVYGVLVH